MKRVDLYSILINHGYKLPAQWKHTMDARADINKFMQKNVDVTEDIKEKMCLYSDEQWSKLVWRLQQNGHYKN